LLYGSEIWTLNEYYRKRLLAVEMDYLRMSARVSRLEHMSNQEIRTRMNAEESIIDKIKNKGRSWFGRVLRMEEERWSKQL
jgi:ppGpp synthetase/RelA/SpoT-type nucleotidyltranferase